MRTALQIPVCVLILAATSSAQRTITLEPSKDASMFANSGTLACGRGVLVSGRTVRFGVRRALVAFPVASKIPAGSKITSVTVQMTVLMTISGSKTSSLHRVLSDWGEAGSACSNGGGAAAKAGDATWTHRFFKTKAWTKAGGDFVAAASASAAGSAAHVWSSNAALISDVQAWLDRPATNFGWLIETDEKVTSARLWGSRESQAASRPKLVVQFKLPPAMVVSIGKGCADTNGRDLRQTASGLPKLGNKTFSLAVTNGPTPGLAVLFLAARLQTPPIKLNANNCFLYISLPSVATAAASALTNGNARFPVPIPGIAALAGVKFDSQVLSFDRQAVLRTSNALTGRLGG